MRKLKILIIDNDEDEQFFIRKGFLATGLFEISTFLNNGNELVNTLLSISPPDVIMSDLNMPGKNGFEILEDLKSNSVLSTIPVIITSNATTPDLEEQCRKLGAFDLKAKPDNFLNYEVFAKNIYDEITSTFKIL